MTSQHPRYWGMAGVFPGDLNVYDGNVFANKKRFVRDHGFHGGGIGPDDLKDPGNCAILEQLHKDDGQRYAFHIGLDIQQPVDDTKRILRDHAALVGEKRKAAGICHIQVIVKALHRFHREMSLNEQMDRLADATGLMVELAGEMDLTVSIENHGDYYVSDLVNLCQRVPGLGIMLDTGNCYLIGERPDLIPDEAWPLVKSTHWKDHHVFPDPRKLAFQLTGATLSEGAVGLDAMYRKLLDLHPDPASVFMLIEWVPDPAKKVWDCFRASKAYLEKVSEGAYRDPEAHA